MIAGRIQFAQPVTDAAEKMICRRVEWKSCQIPAQQLYGRFQLACLVKPECLLELILTHCFIPPGREESPILQQLILAR